MPSDTMLPKAGKVGQEKASFVFKGPGGKYSGSLLEYSTHPLWLENRYWQYLKMDVAVLK